MLGMPQLHDVPLHAAVDHDRATLRVEAAAATNIAAWSLVLASCRRRATKNAKPTLAGFALAEVRGYGARSMGERRVRGRGPAPRAPGPAGRLAGGAAARAAAALGARQPRRPGGAAQGLDSREGGASLPEREAPLRLRAGAVSGIGQEPDPAVPVVGIRQSAAGGARRAGVSGRAAAVSLDGRPAGLEGWHARRDSNPRPLVPKARSGHLMGPDENRSGPIQTC